MPDVAVVTGAGKGLGASIAEVLAERGFSVVVNTRERIAEAQSVADRIRSRGGTATVVAADVSDRAAVEAMFDAVRTVGRLRVLVNNASSRPLQPLEEIAPEDFHQVLAVTLEGAFTCVHHALPILEDGGRIVNILGSNAMSGDGARVHVSAAKHGLLGLTLGLAAALRDRGITVNAVSPNIPATEPEPLQECQRRIAETVGLLAGPDAGHVTGAVIDVDCSR